MASPKLDRRIERITLEETAAFGKTQDRWLWICDNILDPLDLPCTEANVSRVESYIYRQLRIITLTFQS